MEDRRSFQHSQPGSLRAGHYCGLSADLQQGSSDKAGFYPAACPSQTGTSAGAGQWSDPGSAGRGISGGTGSRPCGKKKRDQ